jgi:hypothetical protein
MLGEGTQSLQASSKFPGLVLVNPTAQIVHEAPLSAASILSMSATTVSSPKKRSETAPIAQTEQRIWRITGIAQVRIEALVVLRLLNWKNGSKTVTLVIKILVRGSLSRL